ncbi:hypothetical protein JQ597_34510 [Bradyrhizobium sp. AUGA SZCCT0177]|uniref:hypothetical protein n=1 Tax=unclassified Bradyrhizobium TaxID=2631580 RepID=UPI001BAE1A11|nr:MULTISPECIES: hypothetical protein [unclassified Bradyrhizobium]MBR1236790.1 hypothetical protein [Bradyrhizobium sp. AUGA SZCCT0182]MBR1287179.1 hypothetical protein [Bradyrhizobium sp. AUGA SZCCT0177]
MSRQAILSSLIHLDAPLADLKLALASISWDAEPTITLARQDIATVLQRFVRGEIDAAVVEEWANLVECREDIQSEAGHEETIAAAIHDLANPELRGRLATIAPDVLSRLA